VYHHGILGSTPIRFVCGVNYALLSRRLDSIVHMLNYLLHGGHACMVERSAEGNGSDMINEHISIVDNPVHCDRKSN
jgi:hypothetical protein